MSGLRSPENNRFKFWRFDVHNEQPKIEKYLKLKNKIR